MLNKGVFCVGIYIINIILIVIMKPIIGIISKKSNKIYVSVMGVWFFLVFILRANNIGIDLKNYLPRYIMFGKAEWKDLYLVASEVEAEIGYATLNKLLYYFFKNERTIIYITALIFVIGFCTLIYKKSKNSCLSFIIFVCIGLYADCFSTLRQMIAVIMISGSFQYIEKQDIKKFLMIVVLASFFHKSAICILPMYFIVNKRIDTIVISAWVIGCAVCIIFGENVMRHIAYRERYAVLIAKGSNGAVGLTLLSFLIAFLMLLILKDKKSRETRMYIYFQLIMCFLCVLTFTLPITARVISYFSMYLLVSLPNTCNKIEKIYTRWFVNFVLSAIFILYYFLIICRADMLCIIPYKFFWME